MNAPKWRHCCAKERGIFHLPQGSKCSACGEGQKPGVPAAVRGKLAMLREEFAHLASKSAVEAERWRGLDIQERRFALLMVGMDDSEEAARRPWDQLLPEVRAELVMGMRGMRRVVGRLAWA